MSGDSDFASAATISGDDFDGETDETADWRQVVVFGVVGSLVIGVAQVLFLMDTVSEEILAAGIGVGCLSIAAGVVYLVNSLQLELAAMRSDMHDAVKELRDRDPIDEREELIARLRRQEHHAEQLLEMIPEQQDDMETLAAEVERRNRIVKAVLEEDVPNQTVSNERGTGTGTDARPNNDGPSSSDTRTTANSQGKQTDEGGANPDSDVVAGNTPTADTADTE